ncbi:MAG: hypothetical protein HOB73_14335 [Planctomycetaceae bacterium]|nr:hypothetical protein [Planctomycetaceae bacterium]
MNKQRHVYLGWDIPPIETLAHWLTSHYTFNQNLDLSDTIIALPAATAVKFLLTRLIEHCQTNNLCFLPPTAVTLGHLPEYLYTARPTASPSLQALLWSDVARNAASTHNLDCVFPTPPHMEDFTSWYAIGETLATLHTELAGDLKTFQSVVEYCDQSGHTAEVQRWQQLSVLQRSYHDEVDLLGFWDIQTARMIAVQQSECCTEKTIIVAGCVDVNQTIQGMLNDVSDNLTVLTFAPESEQNRFHENGALNSDKWHDEPLPITDNQLTMVDSPSSQALACATVIAKYSTATNSQQDFVIACPDPTDQPYIVRLFNRQSTCVSPLRGRSLQDNVVITTLRVLGDFAQTNSYQSFSSLLRLPDIQQYLTEAGIVGDLISISDHFHEEHLPRHSGRLRGLTGKYGTLADALHKLDKLVLPLTSGTARLSHWCNTIMEILNSLYGSLLIDTNNPQDTAVLCGSRAISQSIAELAEADHSFNIECVANECIELAIQLASKQFETIQVSSGVMITGWLDVVWGEQANVLVTGFNEGTIPSSITSDLFLPDSLRTSLGLVDNTRRFARDAYTTALLANSRNTVTFFCKRTDAMGMPLWPSRLALTGDARQTAERLNNFSSVEPKSKTLSPIYNVAANPPKMVDIAFADVNRTEFTVTEFRDYLSCPTRYYLKHILAIAAVTDDSRELSALAFGNLLHDTLNDFGKSVFSSSTDAEAIYDYLESQLRSRADKLYGKYSYGVIQIQVSQLCKRLHAFACWQAAWIADGWEIIETEFSCNPGVPISMDHPDLIVRGRIDRIDYHAASSSWSIFDYKSSESCQQPEKVHRCKDAPYWKDLQLPLYRHIAKSLTGSAEVRLGYINICNDLPAIGEYFAEWDSEQLNSADLVALNVMQAINSNDFKMRNDTKPNFFSDFAYLLGDTALDNTSPIPARGTIE